MKRREFIAGLVAAAWPLAARAQQSAVPVVGFLYSSRAETFREFIAPFAAGLAETGYIEGRNVAFEYRLVGDRLDRLPALADDLIRARVAVIVAAESLPAVAAAKAATRTIPIVFHTGADPVKNGVVTGLARPGGNVTGFTALSAELFGKRLALLHELVPSAATIAYLINRANAGFTEALLQEQVETARHIGVRLPLLNATNPDQIEAAFAALAGEQAGALLVAPETLFTAQRDLIIRLAAHHRIPTSYSRRVSVEAGGLMSFAADTAQIFRQVGIYAGRILKGEKPGDLPVQQPTRFELAINMKTAKALGLTVPPGILAIADEVIE